MGCEFGKFLLSAAGPAPAFIAGSVMSDAVPAFPIPLTPLCGALSAELLQRKRLI